MLKTKQNKNKTRHRAITDKQGQVDPEAYCPLSLAAIEPQASEKASLN